MRRLLVAPLAALFLVAFAVPAVAAPVPDDSHQANNIVRDIGYGNGNMYLVGEFTSMRPDGAPAGTGEVARNHAAAISIATGALQRWNPNVNGIVYAVEVVGHVVYLGGKFTSVDGKPRQNLAAVDDDTGSVLSTWAPKTGIVREIAKHPNGDLFIGGSFSTVNSQPRSRIAQISPGGVLRDWAPRVGQIGGPACPPRCPPVVFAIDFSADGQTVYFGGHFGTVNDESRNEAAAVPINNDRTVLPWNPNIYADANCPTCQTVETHRVYTLFVASSKVYMCGGFWKVNGTKQAYNILVTDLVNGTADPVFAAATDGDTAACALHNGVLYAGGHFNWVGPICSPNPPPGKSTTKCTQENGSTRRNHVAAFNATTGEIFDWNPTANSNLGPWVAQSGPGVLGWGGHFTKFGKVLQQGVAKFTSGFAV